MLIPFLCCCTRWCGWWCTTFWVKCPYWSRWGTSHHSPFTFRKRNLQIHKNSPTLHISALKMETVCAVTAQSSCPITNSHFRYIHLFNSIQPDICSVCCQGVGSSSKNLVVSEGFSCCLWQTKDTLITEEGFSSKHLESYKRNKILGKSSVRIVNWGSWTYFAVTMKVQKSFSWARDTWRVQMENTGVRGYWITRGLPIHLLLCVTLSESIFGLTDLEFILLTLK